MRDLAITLLTPGQCVRCKVATDDAYLCADCDAAVARKREAIASRDAMDDLVRRVRESELPPRYKTGDSSLETYKPKTRGQKAALAAVTAWANGDPVRPWLYLYGPVGTGKTHLAASALHAAILAGQGGRFVSLVDLLGRMRRTYQGNGGGSDYDILEAYRTAKFLVVDDLGTEKATAWSIQVLTDLVNCRYETGRPTIFTSNYSLRQIGARLALPDEEVSAERIVDRIAELAVPVPLDGNSHRTGGTN